MYAQTYGSPPERPGGRVGQPMRPPQQSLVVGASLTIVSAVGYVLVAIAEPLELGLEPGWWPEREHGYPNLRLAFVMAAGAVAFVAALALVRRSTVAGALAAGGMIGLPCYGLYAISNLGNRSLSGYPGLWLLLDLCALAGAVLLILGAPRPASLPASSRVVLAVVLLGALGVVFLWRTLRPVSEAWPFVVGMAIAALGLLRRHSVGSAAAIGWGAMSIAFPLVSRVILALAYSEFGGVLDMAALVALIAGLWFVRDHASDAVPTPATGTQYGSPAPPPPPTSYLDSVPPPPPPPPPA